jgi:asparagine synthetase B (glutamine-hydrolysing)
MLEPMRQARRDGCRVIMSGYWADQVLSGDAYHMPDMLRDVSVARMPDELPHFVRATGRPSWWLLPYAHVRSLLPARVRHLLRRNPPPQPLAAGSNPPPGGGTLLLPPAARQGHAPALIYQQLTDGLNSARLLMHDTIAEHVGAEWRFPFLDRRLVDFLINLPADMRFRRGWTKYVLRQAMDGILPEKVRRRTTFARFDELTERGLRERERKRVEALLDAPLAVSRGLVDGARLASAWELYWQGSGLQPHRHLIGPLCVEAWLRHRRAMEVAESGKRDKLEVAYQ